MEGDRGQLEFKILYTYPMTLYGGIEAGGTKFVCGIGDESGRLLESITFPTTTPGQTLARALAFFAGKPLAALGIGTFGPVDLRPDSPAYGRITSTPKPGWANTDMLRPFRERLGVPVGLDTDVNAAALGEHRWGAAQGLDTFVYLTVGTGIGGGGMAGGRLMHGALHPEMGHVRVPHDWARDPFAGVCPYHGDCLEGLASGPAIEARWGVPGESLPADHPAWELEAHYLALGVANLVLTLSPQRVILGGGVMGVAGMLPRVRALVLALLNGYLQIAAIVEDIEGYIVPPGLGTQAGVRGALALAIGAAFG